MPFKWLFGFQVSAGATLPVDAGTLVAGGWQPFGGLPGGDGP